MLRELISEKEYEMLAEYRNWYGICYSCIQPTVSIYDYLSSWENEKQDLFKLLGNNLILSKEFHFNKALDELDDEMQQLLRNSSFTLKILDAVEKNVIKSDDYWTVQRLFYADTLVDNKFSDCTSEINFKDNRTIKIVHEAKPMKIIKKLSEMFNIDGFEEFRLQHSQILNQKTLKGKINLSIHPMDFWTLSDNDCDWSSCMSWREDECYKRGTIATMNSPYVLVAYLSASRDMKICRDCDWNNKKWRQLFIVNNGIVCSVKAYPYENMDLTETVLKWIKELAKTNMNWEYEKEISSFYDSSIRNIILDDSEYYNIDFSCDPMYCDIGSCTHLYSISSKIIDYKEFGRNIHICYGGDTPCLCCGEQYPEYDHEGQLICNNCLGHRCYNCDCLLNREDELWLDGDVYCEDCYERYKKICICCGETINENYASQVIIIPRNIEKIKKLIPDFNENSIFYRRSCLYYQGYHENKEVQKAIKNLLTSDDGLIIQLHPYNAEYFVYADSLKEEVIKNENFDWSTEEEYVDWLLTHNSKIGGWYDIK